MEKVIENFLGKILDYINIECEEYPVIAYGLHQMILNMLNVLTAVILGFLWGKLIFIMLFLGWVIILRPFAGGYHADTQLRCYLLSVVALNIILACKYYLIFSMLQYLIIWGITFVIVFLSVPVENSSNILNKNEIETYGKIAKRILFKLSVIMFLALILKIEVIYSSIVFSLLLVSVLLLAGKMKYRGAV